MLNMGLLYYKSTVRKHELRQQKFYYTLENESFQFLIIYSMKK